MKNHRLELSVTNGGKEGRSEREASNPHLGQWPKWYWEEEELGMDSSIEYPGIATSTSERKLGSKEANRRMVWKRGVGIITHLIGGNGGKEENNFFGFLLGSRKRGDRTRTNFLGHLLLRHVMPEGKWKNDTYEGWKRQLFEAGSWNKKFGRNCVLRTERRRRTVASR